MNTNNNNIFTIPVLTHEKISKINYEVVWVDLDKKMKFRQFSYNADNTDNTKNNLSYLPDDVYKFYTLLTDEHCPTIVFVAVVTEESTGAGRNGIIKYCRANPVYPLSEILL